MRANSRVDVVHLLELVVRHVGLGEQHVHVARHAAGDRVDRVRAPRRRASRARSRGRRPRVGPGRPPCRSRARRRPGARRRAGSRRRQGSSSGTVPRPRRGDRAARGAEAADEHDARIERFIASAISLVRIEPDAPTSMPATISAMLSSAMPAAAALRPVNAFSVEMTTGMSAPPIGSTARMPSAPADTRISQNSSCCRCRGDDRRRSATATAQERDVDDLLAARELVRPARRSAPAASRTRRSSPRSRSSR